MGSETGRPRLSGLLAHVIPGTPAASRGTETRAQALPSAVIIVVVVVVVVVRAFEELHLPEDRVAAGRHPHHEGKEEKVQAHGFSALQSIQIRAGKRIRKGKNAV